MRQKHLSCKTCKTPIQKNSLGNYYCPSCEPAETQNIGPETFVMCPGCGEDLSNHFKTIPALTFGVCPHCGERFGRHMLEIKKTLKNSLKRILVEGD